MNPNLKNIYSCLLAASLTLVLSTEVLAQQRKKVAPKKPVAAAPKRAGRKVYTQSTNPGSRNQISQALGLLKSAQYPQAANAFLALSRRGDMVAERPQIKLYLGLALMEQNLNQVAAFQFVDVIKAGDQRWTRQAIEKLLIVTDRLGDETLLNYAIQ